MTNTGVPPVRGALLEALLAKVDEGVVFLDRDWRYRYVNRAGAAIFGREPGDLIGRHIWTEFPEGVGQPFHRAYERAMETQESSLFEDYLEPRDRWFENRLYPSPQGLAILYSDITTRKRAELQQGETLDRLQLVVEGTHIGFWDWDLRSNAVRFSREYKAQIGHADDELADDLEEWRVRVHPDDLPHAMARVQEFLAAPSPGWENEFRLRHRDGSYRWMLARAHLIRDARGEAQRLVGFHLDITQRKTHRILLEGQGRVLAMAARGEDLPSVLEALCLSVERVIDGSLVSVLLLDEDGLRVRHGAAPTLPASYVSAIDGQRIGPKAGSCGTAMYRAAPVIVDDIRESPLWHDYLAIADAAGVRACWSTPILDETGNVLGSFAIYHREPRRPTDMDQWVIDAATSQASVVLAASRRAASLVASVRQLRRVIHDAPSAIAMFDSEMRYIAHSRRWVTDYGLDASTLAGRSHYDVFPEITDQWKAVHQKALSGIGDSRESDPFTRADGTVQWLRWDVSPWREADGRVGGIIIATEDVTSQREAEQALRESNERLRHLASGLELAREQERKRIARELHDELGQALTGVKMDLTWLRQRLTTGDLIEHLERVARLVDDTVAIGRRIASELRPGVLDDLGLAAALRWQGKEFERRHGIKVTLHVSEELPVTGERATAGFRIVQEALTNVARHANASTVEVRAAADDGMLVLEVLDDGSGIPSDAAHGRHSFGVLGMRERVGTWKGTLDLDRRPEGGTRLLARIPLAEPETGH